MIKPLEGAETPRLEAGKEASSALALSFVAQI